MDKKVVDCLCALAGGKNGIATNLLRTAILYICTVEVFVLCPSCMILSVVIYYVGLRASLESVEAYSS